ncbi:hypothetical protein AB0H71_26390 [Nocardia sp. NPDC050697]|uniref:hypothetical protein n=1 Tax=Nocardia sp. NPDC050697 TaxID=3155158 RepID=UPI0033CDD7B7
MAGSPDPLPAEDAKEDRTGPLPELYGSPAYPAAPHRMTTTAVRPFHPVYGAVPQVPPLPG